MLLLIYATDKHICYNLSHIYASHSASTLLAMHSNRYRALAARTTDNRR
jgi:hypothetical protein